MSLIKTFFGLVLISVFVVVSYWMYATYTAETGDDPIWAGINVMMPEALRQWSCKQVGARAGAEPAPQGCARYWDAPAQEAVAAPGAEADGQRLRSEDGEAVDAAPASSVGGN